MAQRTVNTNQLTPGSTIMIRGLVGFSRIASQISGEELQKDIQRRASKGWNPINRPYTTITIYNAQVLYENPNQKTFADIYADEHLFVSQNADSPGNNYTAVNKGNNLPYVAVMSDATNAKQIAPEGELARGLDVTIVLRVFKSPQNNGVSLDGVIVNEPIRYREMAGSGLAQRGITFEALPPSEQPQPITPDETPQMNQPAPVAPPAPNQNPYSAQPVMPNAQMGQPQMPMNNGYQQTMGQPMTGQPIQQTPNFGMNPPQPTTPPFQNPVNMGSEAGGIRYNPTDRQYN